MQVVSTRSADRINFRAPVIRLFLLFLCSFVHCYMFLFSDSPIPDPIGFLFGSRILFLVSSGL